MSEAEDSMMERLMRAAPMSRPPFTAAEMAAEARRVNATREVARKALDAEERRLEEQRQREAEARRHAYAERVRTDGLALAKILRDRGFEPDSKVWVTPPRKRFFSPGAMECPAWIVDEEETYENQRIVGDYYEDRSVGYTGLALMKKGELVVYSKSLIRSAANYPATDLELDTYTPARKVEGGPSVALLLENFGVRKLWPSHPLGFQHPSSVAPPERPQPPLDFQHPSA